MRVRGLAPFRTAERTVAYVKTVASMITPLRFSSRRAAMPTCALPWTVLLIARSLPAPSSAHRLDQSHDPIAPVSRSTADDNRGAETLSSALIVLMGLFRHPKEGFEALTKQVVAPNEARGIRISLAVFTDNTTACSSKELAEHRCTCVHLPPNVTAASQEIYGSRLLHVHVAEHSSFVKRLADAWANGLQTLIEQHDVAFFLRPDTKLTRPLLFRDACRQRSSAKPCDKYCQWSTPRAMAWTAHLACSRHAAAAASSPANVSEARPMWSDTLRPMGVTVQLMHCPGVGPAVAMHKNGMFSEDEEKWIGVMGSAANSPVPGAEHIRWFLQS